jgi:hypothetical protein
MAKRATGCQISLQRLWSTIRSFPSSRSQTSGCCPAKDAGWWWITHDKGWQRRRQFFGAGRWWRSATVCHGAWCWWFEAEPFPSDGVFSDDRGTRRRTTSVRQRSRPTRHVQLPAVLGSTTTPPTPPSSSPAPTSSSSSSSSSLPWRLLSPGLATGRCVPRSIARARVRPPGWAGEGVTYR